MITEREQKERMAIMQNALANQKLEGLEPDTKTIADSEKWVRGEMEMKEIIENLIVRVKRGDISN